MGWDLLVGGERSREATICKAVGTTCVYLRHDKRACFAALYFCNNSY